MLTKNPGIFELNWNFHGPGQWNFGKYFNHQYCMRKDGWICKFDNVLRWDENDYILVF